MHLATKILFAVLAAIGLAGVGWYVVDNRRARRHRQRRLEREARERAEYEAEQATGTEGDGAPGVVIDADVVAESEVPHGAQ